MITLCFSALSQANPKRLKKMIAEDVQSMFDASSINFQVAVMHEDGKPQVRCRISPSQVQEGYHWAFCKVDLEILIHQSYGMKTCTFLYHFHPKKEFFDLTRGNDEDFSSCRKNLAESFASFFTQTH